MIKTLLITTLLLQPPVIAHEHYPIYICDELIVSLVDAVELGIINKQEAKEIILDCKDNATWADE